MMESLALGEWIELAPLRFDPLLEWRGKWRFTKSREATRFEGIAAPIFSLLGYIPAFEESADGASDDCNMNGTASWPILNGQSFGVNDS